MLGMGLGTEHSPFPLRFHCSSHFAEARRPPGRCFRGLQSGCLEAPASLSWDGEGRGVLFKAQILSFPALKAEPENWGVFIFEPSSSDWQPLTSTDGGVLPWSPFPLLSLLLRVASLARESCHPKPSAPTTKLGAFPQPQ